MNEENKSRTVSLPNNLWAKLKRLSEAERRSINSQLAVILENIPEADENGA